jgi:hypothetical protein
MVEPAQPRVTTSAYGEDVLDLSLIDFLNRRCNRIQSSVIRACGCAILFELTALHSWK